MLQSPKDIFLVHTKASADDAEVVDQTIVAVERCGWSIWQYEDWTWSSLRRNKSKTRPSLSGRLDELDPESWNRGVPYFNVVIREDMVDENSLAELLGQSRVVVVLEPRGIPITDGIEKEIELLMRRPQDSLTLHAIWAGDTPKINISQAVVEVVLPTNRTIQEISVELTRWIVIGATIECFKRQIMLAESRALLKSVSKTHSSLARFIRRKKPLNADPIQDLRKWRKSMRTKKPTVESRVSNTGSKSPLVPLSDEGIDEALLLRMEQSFTHQLERIAERRWNELDQWWANHAVATRALVVSPPERTKSAAVLDMFCSFFDASFRL
jgi:hypothetical protein